MQKSPFSLEDLEASVQEGRCIEPMRIIVAPPTVEEIGKANFDPQLYRSYYQMCNRVVFQGVRSVGSPYSPGEYCITHAGMK